MHPDIFNKIVLGWIGENMVSLVQSGMYGAINTDYTTTNGFCVIKFFSESYKLQNNTTIDGQVIYAG